jgi:hypothetical protein
VANSPALPTPSHPITISPQTPFPSIHKPSNKLTLNPLTPSLATQPIDAQVAKLPDSETNLFLSPPPPTASHPPVLAPKTLGPGARSGWSSGEQRASTSKASSQG